MSSLFSKKKKTNSTSQTQQQTSSTTNSQTQQQGTQTGVSSTDLSRTTNVLAPDWAQGPFKDLTADVDALGGVDPQSLVAGSNPLIDRAAQTAAGLGGDPAAYRGAQDVAGYVMNANAPRADFARASGFIDDYMDPGLKHVVDAALADYDFGAGQTRAQLDLDLAGSGAFGGSGVAIEKSMTEDALNRGRASTSANLRSQAFDRAVAAAQGDAARKQSANELNARLYGEQMDRALGAGRQLVDTANNRDANTRSNLGLQGELGQLLRGIEQDQRTAPLNLLQARSQLLQQLGLDKFFGESTTGSTDTTSQGSTSSNSTSSGTSTGTMTGTTTGTTTEKQTPSIMEMAQRAAQLAAMFL